MCNGMTKGKGDWRRENERTVVKMRKKQKRDMNQPKKEQEEDRQGWIRSRRKRRRT